MFTSRAEHRLILRQDNADERLSTIGFKLGLLSDSCYRIYLEKSTLINSLLEKVRKISLKPEQVNDFLVKNESSPIKQKVNLFNIISRPQVDLNRLIISLPVILTLFGPIEPEIFEEVIEAIEIKIKYAGYINRELNVVDKLKRLENIRIDGRFDYSALASLSTEAREKLTKINPLTIGQAIRIPGISPSDINVLLVIMGR
jgi:tRNA uridine 5-carboxymethylaminomethyl modification enzyme